MNANEQPTPAEDQPNTPGNDAQRIEVKQQPDPRRTPSLTEKIRRRKWRHGVL